MDLFEKIDTNGAVNEADRVFYAEFFSYGCSGVLIKWITRGFKEAPETMRTSYFDLQRIRNFGKQHVPRKLDNIANLSKNQT